jgi:hypothetical protein
MNSGTTDCLGTQNDGTRRTIQQFIVHPDYGDRGVFDNDIALIELDSPVNTAIIYVLYVLNRRITMTGCF